MIKNLDLMLKIMFEQYEDLLLCDSYIKEIYDLTLETKALISCSQISE